LNVTPPVKPTVIIRLLQGKLRQPLNNRHTAAEVPPDSLLKASEITSHFAGEIFSKN